MLAMWRRWACGSLLKLAKTLGVEADDVIRATDQEERELLDYSQKFPGFRGEIEFDGRWRFSASL